MHDLPTIASSCGVLLGQNEDGQFEHMATAWSVGPDEWVTAWPADRPSTDLRLLYTNTGAVDQVQGWEWEDGIAGFRAHVAASVPVLPLRRGKDLRKRDHLWALGYPSMIDHPAFRLHRGSLDAERYFPYLCPWVMQGHLALFSANDGYLTGRCYAGMAGGPVLDSDGHVVGVILDGEVAPDHPALTRFHRLI
jgi:hypothetical protein